MNNLQFGSNQNEYVYKSDSVSIVNHFLNSPLDQFETTSQNIVLKIWSSSYENFFGYYEYLSVFSNTFTNSTIELFSLVNVFLIGLFLLGIQSLIKDKSFLVLAILIFFCFVDFLPFYFIDTINVNLSGSISELVINSTLYLNIFVHGTLLSFLTFVFLIEGDEENETLIPRASEMIYVPISKMIQTLLISSIGKDLKDEDDLIVLLGGVLGGILVFNVQGMIPYTHTITSSLTNTLFISLAIFIFILVNMIHQKGWAHFLNLFMPNGCPIALIFLLIPIEIISYTFRVVSLSVRLFANMMAGHTLLKVIVGFSWAMIQSGTVIILFANLVTTLALFALVVLEFAVAFIQTYIYTVLTCIYMKDIFHGH